MSRYTTELRNICEASIGRTEHAGFNDINSVITEAAPRVFNFDFPIFDEDYRLALEIKILRHYYMREICCETVGLWKLYLQSKLCEIMPYYNQLYKTELFSFNPLYDVDYKVDHKGDGTNNGDEQTDTDTSTENNRDYTMTDNDTKKRDETVTTDDDETSETSTTTSDSGTSTNTTNTTDSGTDTRDEWNMYSDTPQGGITGIQNANSNLVDNAYLSNAVHNTENGTSANTGTKTDNGTTTNTQTYSGTTESEKDKVTVYDVDETNERERTENTKATENTSTARTKSHKITTTENYIETVQGKRSGHTYSQLLTEFRSTILNIDQMIINELEPLFFGLWS